MVDFSKAIAESAKPLSAGSSSALEKRIADLETKVTELKAKLDQQEQNN